MVLLEVKEPEPGEEGAEEENTLQFVISTADIDRDRDTISVDGWDLANYEMNPVVLFAHDYGQPPVAQSLKTWVEDGKLKSLAKFTSEEEYPFGYTIYRLYLGKYMRAASVGFLPTKWRWVEEDDRPFGIDFEEQELLEYSAVPVPSNPFAIQEAAKSGVPTEPLREWAHEVMEQNDPGGIWVPKGAARQIVEVLDGKGPIVTYGRGNPRGDGGPATDAKSGDGITVPVSVKLDRSEANLAADAIEFVGVLAEIRALTAGVDLPGKSGKGAAKLRREANFLAAKILPALDAETFEKLFPEVVGSDLEIPGAKSGRVLSKANEDRLKAARDELDAVLEQIGEAEEEPGEVETDAAEDPDPLEFLGIAEASADEATDSGADDDPDPLASLGLGLHASERVDQEEVARE